MFNTKVILSDKKRSYLVSSRKNSKMFWKTLKGNRKHQSNSIDQTQWQHYLKNLFINKENNSREQDDISLENIQYDCSSLNAPICNQEIIDSIHHLKSNRSGGPDGICVEMYKSTINDILPFLNPLFNEIFDSGLFPENWSERIITPLHKKGSINDPNNYRGISLVDSICKIFCHILSNRLTIWCDTFGVIDESKAEFRK